MGVKVGEGLGARVKPSQAQLGGHPQETLVIALNAAHIPAGPGAWHVMGEGLGIPVKKHQATFHTAHP